LFDTEAFRQVIRHFVFPFLYFASVALVVASGVAATGFVGDGIGLYAGIGLILALLIVAGLVLGTFSLLIARLDGTSFPMLSDHLRHCAFLYAFVVIVGALFAAEYIGNVAAGRPMYELPKAVIVWLAAGYAIVANGLVLLWKRCSSGVEAGGAP
jgi:hypothetical protein